MFYFEFQGQFPGPPPTVVTQTFAHSLAKFFIDLEAKNYTNVTWMGKVERNSPAGPAKFSGTMTAVHAVPIIPANEEPEAVFSTFLSNLKTDGWNVASRTLRY
jgi:hypothetical protein